MHQYSADDSIRHYSDRYGLRLLFWRQVKLVIQFISSEITSNGIISQIYQFILFHI